MTNRVDKIDRTPVEGRVVELGETNFMADVFDAKQPRSVMFCVSPESSRSGSRSTSPTITNERMLLPWPKVFLDRSRAVECGTRPRRQEQ